MAVVSGMRENSWTGNSRSEGGFRVLVLILEFDTCKPTSYCLFEYAGIN